MGLSEKQKGILKFPRSQHTALICDGAVRSGKTSIMAMAFVIWAMHEFNQRNFAICGKSVQSAVRNVILPLTSVTYFTKNGYQLQYSSSNHLLTVTRGMTANYFYIFGGKDEASYTLIQGITLAGVMLDEVALMPRSFVDQALARCSVERSRFWFNCNPESPEHWFYKEWILDPENKKDKMYLHFLMEDNPSLSKEILNRYKSLYSGVFYDRYILGKWVAAEGRIYDMFDRAKNVVPSIDRSYTAYYISMDYGTQNPTAMLLWGKYNGTWYAIDEYYYSGREKKKQKTDEEYYADLEAFAEGRSIKAVIIDPSAASMIACIRKHGRYQVRMADNTVLDGIRNTATAISTQKIAICDCCKNTLSEIDAYVWDEKASLRGEDKPLKEHDHAMDAMRYFCQTVLQKGKVKAFDRYRLGIG